MTFADSSNTGDSHIGPYRVLERLGIAEGSEVLTAVGDDGKVVIKRLLASGAANPSIARSFVREATAYARLNHPAIVRMIDFIEESDTSAMVLEHVEGITLQKLLDDVYERREPLSRGAALYVASRIFAALAAAHAARDPVSNEPSPIIHRNVNPSNVLITPEGEVKLAEFGCAKISGAGAQTALGVIKGTFGYMAPEQVLEEPITVSTDVYGAALLTRELLSGAESIPLDGLTHLQCLEKMASPMLEPIESVCLHLPPAVADALRRALQVRPGQRDVTAATMYEVLAGEAGSHPDAGRTALVESITLPVARRVADSDFDHGRDADFLGPSVAYSADDCTSVFVAADLEALLTPSRPATPTIPCVRIVYPPKKNVARFALLLALPAALALVYTDAPSSQSAFGEIALPANLEVGRVQIDGRLVESAGGSLRVRCGMRAVRFDNERAEKVLKVPCGGVIRLLD